MVVAALLGGCSTAPFKPAKKVDKESGFLGSTVFKQNGEIINYKEMASHFETLPETRADIERMRRWNVGGFVAGGAGIGLAVSSVVGVDPKKDRGTSNALLFGAIGMLIVENFCFIKASHALEDAVDKYNSSLKLGFDGKSVQGSYELVAF